MADSCYASANCHTRELIMARSRHLLMIWVLMLVTAGIGYPVDSALAQHPLGQASSSLATGSASSSEAVGASLPAFLPASPALLPVIASASPLGEAPKAVPETVRLERTGSAAPVLFLHQLHESRQSCKDCHGGKEPLFPKFRSPKGYTMAEMQAGRFCGKCHDGVNAYDVRTRCDLCHYNPGGKH